INHFCHHRGLMEQSASTHPMTEQPPRSGQRRRVSERTTRELERLWRPVSMAVRRLVPASDPEHDDLVRTALASVVAALAVRPPQARFSESWLVTVARDVTFEHLQRKKKSRIVSFEPRDPES